MPFDSSGPSDWRVLAAPAFCALDLPARQSLLGAVLRQGTIALMRGPKGIGKSHLALEIALAVAGAGKALHWQAPAARRVLFVDADLPLGPLQERLKSLSHGAPPANLALLAAEAQDAFPSLGTPDALAKLEAHLTGVDLLVLDGLSSLMSVGPPSRWQHFALALRAWRKRGTAVLLVDGRGLKGGAAAALEGLLDLTFALAPPLDKRPGEGMRCDVVIEGARACLDAAAAPVEATLEAGAWRVLGQTDAAITRALALELAGYSVREIARALDTSKSRAHRLMQEGRALFNQAGRIADRVVANGATGADGPAHRSPQGEGGTGGTLGTDGPARRSLGEGGTVGTPGTSMARPDAPAIALVAALKSKLVAELAARQSCAAALAASP